MLPPIGVSASSSDPGITTLISQVGGAQANGSSFSPAISGNGQFIAFESTATNLVTGDTNGKKDIFVYDRTAGTFERVSISTSGVQGNGLSFGAAISSDGRFVAFGSAATNLADGITTPLKNQVYLRDRQLGTTTLVTAGTSGTGGNGHSVQGAHAAISADGSTVTFDSLASNLVASDTNAKSDVFAWDRTTGTTNLISLTPTGAQANSDSYSPAVSGDGRYIAFESFATNLTGGTSNALGQIFLRDRTSGVTRELSVNASGTEGDNESKAAAFSSDGHIVAWDSTATNLTADSKPFGFDDDVYARDLVAGTIFRVSLDGTGQPVSGDSRDASISSDGTRIAFTSTASFGPAHPSDEIYVKNRTTAEVVQVSVSSGGAAGNSFSESSSISGDGLLTTFQSQATNLVSPATSGTQVFLNTQASGPPPDFGSALPYTFGAVQAAAYSPDPVNLATGSFTSHADDLILPGRVLSLAFTRWYNSADDSAGPLGPGWTHAYNWSLADHTATVDVRRGDGRRDTFTRNQDGTYADPPNVFDVLVKNGDATFTLTLTSQVAYVFSSAGQLTRINEPAGNQITFTYTSGNLTTITDTVGRQIALSYDGSNGLTQIQDPLGRKVTYAYDGSGRLVTVTDKIGNAAGQNPALHQWKYAYDGTTRHITSITDPDARVRVTNTYDAQGRVYQQRDGLNALTQMAYSTGQTVLTDARAHASTFTFDTRMRVLSQTDVVGANTFSVSYGYDASGNRTSVTDRNGKTTHFTYDTRGNVLTKLDPQINPQTPRYLTQFAYDTKNSLTQVTDPLSFVTTMTYDAATNALFSISRQINATTYAVTKYEYGDATNPGLPTKAIAPRGNTGPTPNYTYATALTYDTQGNLVTRIDPDGAKTTFVYDGVGRLTSFVDPDGYAAGANPADHTWLVAYDENDRETSRTDPLANVLRYGYDGAGDRTTITDRRGNVTTYTYDANTRLATTQQKPDPAGQTVYTTTVTRDGNGNATQITQANGVVTDYAFDALNRLTSVTTHPDAQTNLTTSYVLDGNGQPTSRTTGDTVTVTYGYDALSRLTSVAAPGITTITYAYDAASQRLQLVDGTGTTTYQYDGLGRATQVAAPNGTLTYAYDLDGNRTTLVYPGSQNVTYSYTPGGRLDTVMDWASRLSVYTYQPSGLVSSLAYPNGMRASYTYDRAQRLTQLTNTVSSTTITSDSYTLDAEGNRTAIDEYVQGITPPALTWSASVQVNDNANGQQDRPAIAIGADGASFLIWDDYRSGSNGDIYFSRRDPATGLWSANQKVNNDTTTRTQWEPAIALDGSNNAYAVWSDQRDGNKTPDTNIYASKRSASTGTWSANVRVNNDTTGSAAQGAPAIAARSGGDAISVWEDHRSSQNNIYSSRLPAGSSTWAANLRVTDNTSSHKYTPDVAFGPDGTAYAVWEDDRSGNSDVWFSTLPWGASVWTANVKISDDPGTTAQYDPHIGIDAAGDIIVVWQDNRVANGQVRMRRRPAGSQNWDASIVASDAAAIPVAIALGVSSDGNAFAVWQDARGSSYDIWGAEYTYSSNTWSTPGLASDDPGATAQMRPTVARSTMEIASAWRDDRVTGGDIRARRRTASNGTDHFTYTYDGLNRLTSVTGAGSEGFTFDAASNVTSRTGPSATNTYDTSNRLLSDGTRSFVWDNADRLTARGSDSFGYNAVTRLTTTTVNGNTRTYSYDGDGLLTSRSGASLLWDKTRTPAPLVLSGSDRVVGGLDALYVVHSDGTIMAEARDGLGSIRAETDGSGAVSGAFRYSAYGVLVSVSGMGPSLLGFGGELSDPSGLIYLRARWLDPQSGRFISKDLVDGTASEAGSLNLYGYANGNPTNYGDPAGTCTDPNPGSPFARYCIAAFIPTAQACAVLVGCFRGDGRGPRSDGGTSRVELHIGPDGMINAAASDWTVQVNADGTIGGIGKANPGCRQVGNAYGCAAADPLVWYAPQLRFTVTFGDGLIRVTGSLYPALEVWRYSSEGARPLLYYQPPMDANAPLALIAYGVIGVVPNGPK